jgi:hypothetical protein
MALDHFKKFVVELRADPELAPFADGIERELQAADLVADGNVHMAAFLTGVEWIVSQPKPAGEKLDVIVKMLSLRGQVRISSLRAFAGWHANG